MMHRLWEGAGLGPRMLNLPHLPHLPHLLQGLVPRPAARASLSCLWAWATVGAHVPACGHEQVTTHRWLPCLLVWAAAGPCGPARGHEQVVKPRP